MPKPRPGSSAWLEGFSAHVRAVDYASARPLFHPEILAFGTHQDVLPSLEAWVATRNGITSGLKPTISASPSRKLMSWFHDDGTLAVVIAPWTSTGFNPDGAPFDRPGRATIVFT